MLRSQPRRIIPTPSQHVHVPRPAHWRLHPWRRASSAPVTLSGVEAPRGRPTDFGDLENIDRTLVQSMRYFAALDQQGVTEEVFAEYLEAHFTTTLSDGSEVDLVPNGRELRVSFQEREAYARLVMERRLHESDAQLEALALGLYSVVPKHALFLLTWRQLESIVCGRPDFDVDELRASVRYEGISPNDTRVEYFWQVLFGFFASRPRTLHALRQRAGEAAGPAQGHAAPHRRGPRRLPPRRLHLLLLDLAPGLQ
eukprot:TRINITY_DN16219_c0_g1_i1.p1 TRINITY_DN16219_c0_g1~~TRINITY_DN16219_c0_g1_i1.p1  ORF type:complete len:255 (+),score=33.55 TRINITY_DN16219_c0_g1_i1:242-1006(+)